MTNDLLKSADCVVICTEHSNVDYNRVCELSKVIVDTRNAPREKRAIATMRKLLEFKREVDFINNGLK